MTKNIKNFIEEGEKLFEEKFIPSSLKWEDVVHCTCCSTEEEYKSIKQFISSRQISLIKMIVEDIQEMANTTRPNLLLNEIVNRYYYPEDTISKLKK